MIENAEKQVDTVIPLEKVGYIYLNFPEKPKERLIAKIQFRIITESHEQNAILDEIT